MYTVQSAPILYLHVANIFLFVGYGLYVDRIIQLRCEANQPLGAECCTITNTIRYTTVRKTTKELYICIFS